MTDAQYADHIGPHVVAVERDKASGAVGDYEFPSVRVHTPADLRMRRKYRYRRLNLLQRGSGGLWRRSEKEFDYPVDISERFVRID